MQIGISLALTRLAGKAGPAPLLLNALSLSDNAITQNEAVTINILNATSGSNITVQSGALPNGLTLNSAARTITGTPIVVDDFAFTLRETLDGYGNSPRDTALSIEVEAQAGLSLNDLTDVNISDPENGQELAFDGSDWINQ